MTPPDIEETVSAMGELIKVGCKLLVILFLDLDLGYRVRILFAWHLVQYRSMCMAWLGGTLLTSNSLVHLAVAT